MDTWIKKNINTIVILIIPVIFSCTEKNNKVVVEEPSHILYSFINFWYYWNTNVKLSVNYEAEDTNRHKINKKIFLKCLSTGQYLPLRLKTNDSSYCFMLYKMKDPINSEISSTIAQYGKIHYDYLQLINNPLPYFHFKSLQGNIYNELNCREKIIVVDCWFIGCEACEKDRIRLNQLANNYKEDDSILFISIAFDPSNRIKKFLLNKKITFPVIPGKENYIKDTLNFTLFPTYLIINKYGLVKTITNDFFQLKYALTKNTEF